MSADRSDNSSAAAPPRSALRWRPPRWLVIAGASVIGVVGVLALLVFVAPRHVARYVLGDQLERRGIEADGIKTLDIDLWNRRVWIGPVRFRSGPADPGQLGHLGLRFSLNDLFDRKARIEEISVRGIDLHVRQESDGAITINGVRLSEMLPAAPAGAPAAPPEPSRWGAGLDVLELVDSRLVFTDRREGRLQLELQRVELNGFRTWEPERPLGFILAGALNDVTFNFRGEARPLTETITAVVEGRIENAAVEPVERYTGPLGFERRAGRSKADVKGELSLSTKGELTLTTTGKVLAEAVDLARPGVAAARFDRAAMDYSAQLAADGQGSARADGSITLDIERLDIDTPAVGALRASSARVELPALAVAREADGNLTIEAKPKLTLGNPAIAGAADGSAQEILVELASVVLRAAGADIDMTAAGQVRAKTARLALPSGIAATIGDAVVELPALTFNRTEHGIKLEARGMARLDTTEASAPGDAKLGIGQTTLRFDNRFAIRAAGTLGLTGPLTLELDNVVGGLVDGTRLDLGRATVSLAELDHASDAGRGSLRTSGEVRLSAVKATAAQLPEARIAQATFRFENRLIESDGRRAASTGPMVVAIDEIGARLADGSTIDASTLALDFGSLALQQKDRELVLEARAQGRIAEIRATSPAAPAARIGEVALRIDSRYAATDDGASELSGPMKVDLRTIGVRLADGGAVEAATAAIDLSSFKLDTLAMAVRAGGQADLAGAKLSGSRFGDAHAAHAALRVDAEYASMAGGHVAAGGPLKLDLRDVGARLADGSVADVSSTTIDLSAFKLDTNAKAARATGQAQISTARFSAPRMGEIRSAHANLRIDGQYSGAAVGGGEAGGPFKLELRDVGARLADGGVAEAASATVDLSAFKLDTLTNTLRATGQAQLATARLSTPGFGEARLGQAMLRLDGSYAAPAAGSGTASGPLKIELREASGRLAAGGTFDLGAASLDLASLRAEVKNGGQSLRAAGEARLSALRGGLTEAPEFRLGQASLRLDGSYGADRGGRIDTNGTMKLELREAGARLADGGRLDLAAGEIEAGGVKLSRAGAELGVEGSGAARLAGLRASLPAAAQQPSIDLALGALRAQIGEANLALGGQQARWRAGTSFELEDTSVEIGGGASAKARMGRIGVKDAKLDQNLQASASEVILAKGAIEFSDKLLSAFAAPGGGTSTAPSPAPAIAVKRLDIVDGATLRFRDGSVQPPVDFNVDVKSLRVSNLNTQDPAQRTDLALQAALNEFTTLELTGWGRDLGNRASFEVTGKVERMELHPLSPYAAGAIGTNLESGRLSTDIQAAADQGRLVGAVNLTVTDLGFSPLTAEDAKRLSASVGVPIETVVSLLQDSEGRIRVKIPVSGNLAAPDFDLSDAIGQAIGGAVTAAITAPFQLLLQPVAAIADAASGSRVAFKPLEFKPGQAALEAADPSFVAGLVRLLKERPKLSLKVCGRATAQDLEAYVAAGMAEAQAAAAVVKPPEPGPATAPSSSAPPATTAPPPPPPPPPPTPEQLRAKLLAEAEPRMRELATQRTRAVQRHLLSTRDIKPPQVGECRPTYDARDRGKPRVDFSF